MRQGTHDKLYETQKIKVVCYIYTATSADSSPVMIGLRLVYRVLDDKLAWGDIDLNDGIDFDLLCLWDSFLFPDGMRLDDTEFLLYAELNAVNFDANFHAVLSSNLESRPTKKEKMMLTFTDNPAMSKLGIIHHCQLSFPFHNP